MAAAAHANWHQQSFQHGHRQWPPLAARPQHHHQPHRCHASPRARAPAPAASNSEAVCLAQLASPFNPCIAVWRLPDTDALPSVVRGATILQLDPTGNVHSVWRPHASTRLTQAYWDVLGLLPALVPDGPISILGLAAGSIAWLLQELYPGRCMHGWELDAAVVDVARQHMGLQELQDSGALVVHVGDALLPSAAVPGGSAGIIVDLFAGGQLLPQLTQTDTWRDVRARLAPGGRVLANLGPAPVQGMDAAAAGRTLAALDAMAEAFEGQLVCSSFTATDTANLLALSGPPPTPEQWARVPDVLQEHARGGRFVGWQTHGAYREGLKSTFFDW